MLALVGEPVLISLVTVLVGLLILLFIVAARDRLLRRLAQRRSTERIEGLLRSARSGMLLLSACRDLDGDLHDFTVTHMNALAEELLGHSCPELVGAPALGALPCLRESGLLELCATVLERGHGHRGEHDLGPEDDRRVYEISIEPFDEGLAIAIGLDPQRQGAAERLRHAALHDELTGLPNRTLFRERLERAIACTKRYPDHRFAVLFLDFDWFKIINDSLGHDAGDQLLKSIAQRLRENLRSIDTSARVPTGGLPARLGGDEFVVLLDRVGGVRDAVSVAERLQRELSRPHVLGGREVISTASIGIVTSDMGYDSPDEIIRDADTAMYRAKASGKAQHVVFDEHMHREVVARLELERDLRDAVESNSFELHYGPIVGLRRRTVVGVEALVRWRSATRGLVPPSAFLDLAQELGLLGRINDWVLRAAVAQLRDWQQRFPDHANLIMSVNLARRQLLHPTIAETVGEILAEAGIDPSRLCLEVTEAMVMHRRAEAIIALRRLKALGVRIALDDFGTGHSSLTCLRRLPIDLLKIDRDLISSLHQRREEAAIVGAVVELAHELGVEVVAEGVETGEELAQLTALNCDYVQGHYFRAPASGEEIEDVLDAPDLRGAA